MIRIITRILSPLLQKLYFWYASKPRNFSYKLIRIIVNPGVFYPGFAKSTVIFLDYLDTIDLSSKKVLELGAGSGIISFLAARKGANVTASDINPASIENIRLNESITGLEITTICSDLFADINDIDFDYIIVNPPFYARDPKSFKEMAWFCGENFEFFENFFKQLSIRFVNLPIVYLILSEDCDLVRISGIADKNQFKMIEDYKKVRLGECFYIFKIIH